MHQDHTAIKKFSVNLQGRDFIVGDIHGCFDELSDKLSSHRFNPETDRLFAVGDLIDRGPDSHKVLNWLNQAWFHSCLGNHEEMILNTLTDDDANQDWFQNYGGEWWLEQTSEARSAICAAFSNLPLAIELKTRQGTIGIVHADIPKGMSWPGFSRLLRLGDLNTRKTALWGRSRIKRFISRPVKEIDRVVCGHTLTAKHKITIKANVWFIETGAYLQNGRSHLTVIDAKQLFE